MDVNDNGLDSPDTTKLPRITQVHFLSSLQNISHLFLEFHNFSETPNLMHCSRPFINYNKSFKSTPTHKK